MLKSHTQVESMLALDENILLNTNSPMVFYNARKLFAFDTIDFSNLKDCIKNSMIDVSIFNIKNYHRRKTKMQSYDAIKLLIDSSNLDTNEKYSVIALNSTFFTDHILQKLYLPEVIKLSNYHSINIWFGQKGYFTGPHFDTTHGLLIQIHGRKKFKFISPEDSYYMNRNNYYKGGRMNFSQLVNVCTDYNLSSWSEFKPNILELVLNPGEVLYIPPGWWHEVLYMDDCVSLNYWYNVSHNKGPTWVILGMLACSNNSTIKEILSDINYHNLLNKIYLAIKNNLFNLANILIGASIESVISIHTKYYGLYLGNAQIDDIESRITDNNLQQQAKFLREINWKINSWDNIEKMLTYIGEHN